MQDYLEELLEYSQLDYEDMDDLLDDLDDYSEV